MIGKLMVTIARLVCPDYVDIARKTNLGQLITISFSHYNEMARWCLMEAKVPFHENSYPPVAHILPSLQAHKSKSIKSKSSVSKASPTSTPVMVLPSGDLLADSWSVCNYAAMNSNGKLLPLENEELRALLDNKLGVYVRYCAYYYILNDTNKERCEAMFLQDSHWLWKAFWMLGGKFLVRGLMIRTFRCANRDHFLTVRGKLEALVDQHLDPLVKHRSSKYLSGDQIGVLDIAVASLFAPIVNAPLYAEGRCYEQLSGMERGDVAMRAEVSFWRQKEVGKYVMHLYETRRL